AFRKIARAAFRRRRPGFAGGENRRSAGPRPDRARSRADPQPLHERPGHRARRRARGIARTDDTMLRTPLCDLFGIEVPIILAPMGTCTSAELAAAVSNAGGLGGIGTLFRATTAIKRDIDMVRTLTRRPFAIN